VEPKVVSWKKVGKVKEAHGLKGEMWAIIFDKAFEDFEEVETFALGTADQPERIFEDGSMRAQSKGVVLKTPELVNRNQSEALLNQFVFVPEEVVAVAINDDPEYRDMLGFAVHDKQQMIGQIESFSETQTQITVHVKNAQNEVFDIPFVEDFIVEILAEERLLNLDLPEGLLEINRPGGEKE
jgi:16S rRNA processing protein RimM